MWAFVPPVKFERQKRDVCTILSFVAMVSKTRLIFGRKSASKAQSMILLSSETNRQLKQLTMFRTCSGDRYIDVSKRLMILNMQPCVAISGMSSSKCSAIDQMTFTASFVVFW